MNRRLSILNAIINEFILTAQPVGSHTVMVSYNFSVSPATIRNDMAALEDEGYIFQPHTSSGRVPTDTGYRLYVDKLADFEAAEIEAGQALTRVRARYEMQKAREKIYDAVRIMADATGNVSFATVPDNRRTFFLGAGNVFKQPEFSRDPVQASHVMEILEHNDNFINTLRQLGVGMEPQIFIGHENILPQIHSCALVVAQYRLGKFVGYLGLLGPTRMKYPFNRAIVEQVKKLLES